MSGAAESLNESGKPKGAIYVAFAAFTLILLTQRIGYNPHPFMYGGSSGVVALAPFIVWCLWVFLLFSRSLKASINGLIGWGIMSGSLVISTMVGGVSSYLALLGIPAIYFPLCFYFNGERGSLDGKFWASGVTLLAILFSFAICGQYALQYVFPGPKLFTWSWFWPRNWLVEFNVLNYFQYGVEHYKSNGFVFLESSAAGQFLARCLLFFVLSRKSVKWVPLVGIAILNSYSVSGLILTTLIFFAWLLKRAPQLGKSIGAATVLIWMGAIIFVVIGFGAMVFFWIDPNNFMNRLGEFGRHSSSGYLRYNGPVDLFFYEIQTQGLLKVIIGSGAGSFDKVTAAMGYIVFGSGWIKAFTEFGLLGTFGLCVLLYSMFRRAFNSRVVAIILLVQFMILDGNVVVPQYVAIAWLLTGLVKEEGWTSSRSQGRSYRKPRLGYRYQTQSVGGQLAPDHSQNPSPYV